MGRSLLSPPPVYHRGPPPPDAPTVLMADVGGTNTRFALRRRGRVIRIVRWSTAEFPSLEAAAAEYLRECGGTQDIRHAAIAFAGPITGPEVHLTNHPWSVEIGTLRRTLNLDHLTFINDFAAIALGVPVLTAADREKIGRGRRVPDAPAVVLGPGTGLGTSTIVRVEGGDVPIQGEGGHMPLAASTAREAEVLCYLRQEIGGVTAEHVLSGAGLLRLYRAVAALSHRPPRAKTPAGVTRAARGGRDPVARETLGLFAGFLGTAANALALPCYARGGVFIAGGIVPALGGLFDRRAFRKRFESMDASPALLTSVPTYTILHQWPAFLGLSRLYVDVVV